MLSLGDSCCHCRSTKEHLRISGCGYFVSTGQAALKRDESRVTLSSDQTDLPDVSHGASLILISCSGWLISLWSVQYTDHSSCLSAAQNRILYLCLNWDYNYWSLHEYYMAFTPQTQQVTSFLSVKYRYLKKIWSLTAGPCVVPGMMSPRYQRSTGRATDGVTRIHEGHSCPRQSGHNLSTPLLPEALGHYRSCCIHTESTTPDVAWKQSLFTGPH